MCEWVWVWLGRVMKKQPFFFSSSSELELVKGFFLVGWLGGGVGWVF